MSAFEIICLGILFLSLIVVWKQAEKSRNKYMDLYFDTQEQLREALAEAWWWEQWFRKQNPVLGCGYECDFVHPYGFVPEDGCPIHDPCPREPKEGDCKIEEKE